MKYFRYIYVPHIVIILIFIGVIIVSRIRFINIHEMQGYNYSFSSIYRALKPLLFSSIPLFAIFFKSRLSWFVMLSYFYFLSINLFVIVFFDSKFESIYEVLIFLVFAAITIVSIYIMNKASVYNTQYLVQKIRLNLHNLIAFILGGGISLLVYISKNSYYY